MTALLACVIVQQYSSATSLCAFFAPKEEVGARLKKCYLIFFSLGRIACLKLRNLKLRIHGLSVLYYCLQFTAEIVLLPFIAGL